MKGGKATPVNQRVPASESLSIRERRVAAPPHSGRSTKHSGVSRPCRGIPLGTCRFRRGTGPAYSLRVKYLTARDKPQEKNGSRSATLNETRCERLHKANPRQRRSTSRPGRRGPVPRRPHASSDRFASKRRVAFPNPRVGDGPKCVRGCFPAPNRATIDGISLLSTLLWPSKRTIVLTIPP